MYTFDEKQHVHSLGGRPLCGTSTVMSVVSKPLTWWASGLAMRKFGWLDPKKNTPEDVQKALEEGFKKVKECSIQEYGQLLAEAYKAHATNLKETASAGTDLHAELEKYVKWQMTEKSTKEIFDEKIMPFIKWAERNVKRFLWSETYCYSEKLWLGGISDCGVELNDGTCGIIDFKSSKEVYPAQFWQCAGYDLQISENGGFDKNGKQLFKLEQPIKFYAIVPFGAKNVEPVFNYDTEGCKQAFAAALILYKKLNEIGY